MLKRMKKKHDIARYTFVECCMLMVMIIGIVFALVGCVVTAVASTAMESISTLMWLIPCVVVAVMCGAGLLYVNDKE